MSLSSSQAHLQADGAPPPSRRPFNQKPAAPPPATGFFSFVPTVVGVSTLIGMPPPDPPATTYPCCAFTSTQLTSYPIDVFHRVMTQAANKRELRFFAAVQLARPLLRHITGAVEEGLREWDISVGQRAILEALLSHPGSSLPELTGMLMLKRQFIHRVLKEVLANGLVSSSPSPKRRGAQLYHLTTRGEEAISAIRAAELEKLRMFLATQATADIDAFIRIQSELNLFFAGLAKGLLPLDERTL